ncbi:transporter [Pelomonas sp. SE-A7]|uniref:transporter n=1 Tax=Pelomonas sp. SE-A7 TaxID=3054953 RepID=UPI00259C8041|nr:transporter [Pelomonas sp. SE-A7]MDM4764915.1 transporter [Pelomonas sp. SE-A7]
MNSKHLAIPLLALLLGGAARADDVLITDRPGLVESSSTVGKGRLQLETSLAFARDKSGGSTARLRSTPTLFRIGTGEDWELRIETDGALRSRLTESGMSQRASGYADTALGLKWHVQDGDEASGKPGLAWLFHLDMDSGSAAFRGQGLRPSVRLTAEWELPRDWSAGLIGGLYRDRVESGRHFTGAILGGSLGFALNEAWHGYVELAGEQLASQRHGGKTITAGAGVTWLLAKALQLDLSFSRGVNKAAPDFAWALGLSTRF